MPPRRGRSLTTRGGRSEVSAARVNGLIKSSGRERNAFVVYKYASVCAVQYTRRGAVTGCSHSFSVYIYIRIRGGWCDCDNIYVLCVRIFYGSVQVGCSDAAGHARGGGANRKVETSFPAAEYNIYTIYACCGGEGGCARPRVSTIQRFMYIYTHARDASCMRRKTFTLGNLSLRARRIIIPWSYANPLLYTLTHVIEYTCVCV